MATQHSTPTLETLQAQIMRLQRKVAKLEQERDEARRTAVVKQQVAVMHREAMHRYRGQYLPSDFIVFIRQGVMTLEQAVEQRNKRWPVFQYGGGDGLEQAYQMAV